MRLQLAQYIYSLNKLGHDCCCEDPIKKNIRNKIAGILLGRKWFHDCSKVFDQYFDC